MRWVARVVFWVLLLSLGQAHAQPWLSPFSEFYARQLGELEPCKSAGDDEFRVCSPALRNEGNAPFVLHHQQPTEKAVVLFHGLSDSPFFFRSIAPALHREGFTVFVALLPGHGQKDADADMEDDLLAERWQQHVADVIGFANQISDQVYVGGFSTGGALAVNHMLSYPEDAQGILLFSGAMALDESVENMSRWWGMRWFAKWLDGDYPTDGPNPYKYPSVSSHSAIMLTDVIFAIREKMAAGKTINAPIFVAHSMADKTTPWRGVKTLLDSSSSSANVAFVMTEQDNVCHADVVVSASHLEAMRFDLGSASSTDGCDVPHANPRHEEMLSNMVRFLSTADKTAE